MSAHDLRVVHATDLALRDLQPLAEAVFGARARAPGWFVRKLAREAVDPARSLLAFGPGDAPVGYLLICDEPDLVHSAGLGVLPQLRGHGLGSALMLRALDLLRGAGVAALEMGSEPPRRRFYERLGFIAGDERHTLSCGATGPTDLELPDHEPRAWTLPGLEVAGWRAGTWSRTPSNEAATVSLAGGAWAHLSREGRAILVQRLCIPDAPSMHERITATQHALDDLRGRFIAGTPLLLYGCKAVSCVTAALVQRGPWSVVQTVVPMRFTLAPAALAAVDKHAGPAA